MRFGTFELNVRSRELRSGGVCVRLQEQPLEILRLMLERPGEVVTREELRQRLWPEGTFVDFEHSLNAAIKRLRAALGDDADKPTFIETVPRRGYRFIGSVPGRSGSSAAAASASPRVRLVVLPFSNLSDDSSQEYFSDGLTEELIAQLGPLCRGQVGIIARWSSMFFKGSLQRAREIGEALSAEYLLEGSTRRDGSRVRITARLVEAATEAHLWSETYERSTADWLSVQADVAGRVARSLMRELVPPARAVVAPRDHPVAYQAYLKGRYHWARPGDIGLDEALRCFSEAVTEAPTFAAALGRARRAYASPAPSTYHELPRVALAAARESASRALAIDPTVSEAHAVMGDIKRVLDADWVAAEASYAEALALNPSNEAALRSYGLMLALESRYAEALDCVDRARELDPLCLATSTTAHVGAIRLGRLRRRDRPVPAHARDGSRVRERASRARGGAAAGRPSRGGGRAAGAGVDLRRLASRAAGVARARQGRDGLPDAAARADRARPRARGHTLRAAVPSGVGVYRPRFTGRGVRRARSGLGSIATPRSRCSTRSRGSSRSEATRAIAR